MNRQRISTRASTRGFTLIELTAALAVLGIGLFGVLSAYTTAIDVARTQRESAIVHAALVNELEIRRATPAPAADAPRDEAFVSDTPALRALHKPSASVRLAPVDGVRGLVELTARVTWTGGHGRRIERALCTRMAAGGHTP